MLATVATGVVGVDPAGRVLIANRQAVDLLGASWRRATPFLDRLGPEWAPLAAAVRRFLTTRRPPAAELEAGGRRISFQLASLGPDVRGVVIALNDVTDVSRAERVLAWGEMARQVAHEIKNPLTPMRLGMQHLRRVYRDRRADFDARSRRPPGGCWARSTGWTPSRAPSAGSPLPPTTSSRSTDRSRPRRRRSGAALPAGGGGL